MRENNHTTQGVLSVKSYVFAAELVEEEDGRWSAGVPALSGCATWGHTKEEALSNLRDAVEAYIRAVQKTGGEIPDSATTQVSDKPVVAVTV